MTSKFTIVIYVIFIGLRITTPAFAEEKKQIDPKTIPNAEDLIKHCWDISEEKRMTTNTELNREGNLETALCLEEEIIKHASALIDITSMTKEQITESLKNIRFTYGGLYWMMYNENKACRSNCGRYNHMIHNAALAAKRLKRHFVAIELLEQYANAASR